MTICFELTGNRLSRIGDEGWQERPFTDEDLGRLKDWTARYQSIRAEGNDKALLPVGQEMCRWLEGAQKWLSASIKGVAAPVFLEFRGGASLDEKSGVFVNAPWELLADDSGFLAKNPVRSLCVARRLGRPAAVPGIDHGNVSALFMAADGQGERSYEAEEAAILLATSGTGVNLAVEDSGALDSFAERADLEQPLDVVHLSCKGDVDSDGGVLLFEDAYGRTEVVHARRLLRDGFRGVPPSLLFVSAAQGAAGARRARDGDVAVPVSISLIQAGFPAVVSWAGPVREADAAYFAREFYSRLVAGMSIEEAASVARSRLIDLSGDRGRNWHLPRVYLGERGGGPVCAAGQPPRRRALGPGSGRQLVVSGAARQYEMLQTWRGADNNPGVASGVVVASRQSFVGRRPEFQSALRAFKENMYAGVLIHGQPMLGKTSLAARIASRMPRSRPVVISTDYHALTIFREFLLSCPAKVQPELDKVWREQIAIDPSRLRAALEEMLSRFLNSDQAILFIMDGMERILDRPRDAQAPAAVKHDFTTTVRCVLEAFTLTLGRTDSRLLITSRWPFTAPVQDGRDLAKRLHAIALAPMSDRDRQKQLQSRLRLENPPRALDAALSERCIAVAAGCPGVQAALANVALADTAAAAKLLSAVERHFASSPVPAAGAVRELPDNFLFENILSTVDGPGRALLRSSTLFAIPMSELVLSATAQALSAADYREQFVRLSGLGLLDAHGAEQQVGKRQWLVNPRVRSALLKEVKGAKAPAPSHPVAPGFEPGVVALNADEQVKASVAAVAALERLWTGEDGQLAPRRDGLELLRLAELAGDWPLMAACACSVASWLESQGQQAVALKIGKSVIRFLESKDTAPSVRLMRVCSTLASQIGAEDEASQLLERALNASLGGFEQASLWLDWGASLVERGDSGDALPWLDKAQAEFLRLGRLRERTWAVGLMADVRYAQGDYNGALRLLREDMAPDLERIGDTETHAAVMAKIAEIRYARNEQDGGWGAGRSEQPAIHQPVTPPPPPVHQQPLDEWRFEAPQGPSGSPMAFAPMTAAPAVPPGQAGGAATERSLIDPVLTEPAPSEAVLADRILDEPASAPVSPPFPFPPVAHIEPETRSQPVAFAAEDTDARYDYGDVAMSWGMTDSAPKKALRDEDRSGFAADDRVDFPQVDFPMREGFSEAADLDGALDGSDDGDTAEVWAIPRVEEASAPQHYVELDARQTSMALAGVGRTETIGGPSHRLEELDAEVLASVEAPGGDSGVEGVSQAAGASHMESDWQAEQASLPAPFDTPREAAAPELPADAGVFVAEPPAQDMFPVAAAVTPERKPEVNEADIVDVHFSAGAAEPEPGLAAFRHDDYGDNEYRDNDYRADDYRDEDAPAETSPAARRQRATAMSEHAASLYARGELDEALNVLREDVVPVMRELGDEHGHAVVMGRIADILFDRGDLDECLRIRCEDEAPVFERLGDEHARIVTLGKIADILYARGDIDEALRIRCEEEAPVLDRLGDLPGLAVCVGKIADLFYARGDQDEALRICHQEQLPIYEQIGDVRGRAGVMGRIADMLHQRGELDEALRIHREEEEPVYRQAGDVRAQIGVLGQIAEIHYTRGEMAEALRIHEEERLPLVRELGDLDNAIHILWRASRIRLSNSSGDPATFERVRASLSEAYGLAMKLERLDAVCATASDLGRVCAALGDMDKARSLLIEARDGYVRLGWMRDARQVEEQLKALNTTGSGPSRAAGPLG